MCSKIATSSSTQTDWANQARNLLQSAQVIVVGAGAGLSASGGLTYHGPRFQEYFGDFAQVYPIENMYAGGFYPFPTPEEQWGWWCRHIYYNRFAPPALETHLLVLDLVGDKDYFVLTTNVDHQFQKAGFAPDRLFYTQGDYGRFQCATPCRQETFANQHTVEAMIEAQQGRTVPTHLIPHCPHCGQPLTPHLRKDDSFVQDAGWHQAHQRYVDFLQANQGKQVLFLELGVGYNTPAIIKYPFFSFTHQWPSAKLLSLNLEQTHCPPEIQEKSLFLEGDILTLLRELSR